jgi:hypothetical protein
MERCGITFRPSVFSVTSVASYLTKLRERPLRAVEESAYRLEGEKKPRQDASAIQLDVPLEGVEPPLSCENMDLNHARLPIPPQRRGLDQP